MSEIARAKRFPLHTKEKNLLELLQRGVDLQGLCDGLGTSVIDIVSVKSMQRKENKMSEIESLGFSSRKNLREIGEGFVGLKCLCN